MDHRLLPQKRPICFHIFLTSFVPRTDRYYNNILFVGLDIARIHSIAIRPIVSTAQYSLSINFDPSYIPRMPLNNLNISLSLLCETDALGFLFFYIFDAFICSAYLFTTFAFVMIYVSFCLFIGTNVADISASIARLNSNNAKHDLITKNLINIVQKQLDCFRLISNFFKKILTSIRS